MIGVISKHALSTQRPPKYIYMLQEGLLPPTDPNLQILYFPKELLTSLDQLFASRILLKIWSRIPCWIVAQRKPTHG